MLGVSPTLIRALIPKGEPQHDLSSLQAICTTGEPWNRDPYLWLFEHVGGGRAPIVNISGGTEVGACFLSTCIVEPVKPVALGFPALGEDMDVVDAAGRSVRGEVGELVCRQAVAGDDARRVARPRALPRDVLAALPRRVDARRLGVGRRGRLLVPARPQRRHAEHRRASASARPSSSRRRSRPGIVAEAAAVGIPHEVKGETAWLFCVVRARRGARCGASSRMPSRPRSARRSSRSGSCGSARCRRRAARRSCDARCARRRSGEDPGDLSSLENPEVAGGDRGPCQSLTDRSRSSPAAAAASARTSRASCVRQARASRSRRARATSSRRSRSRSTRTRSSPTSRSATPSTSMVRAVESGRGPIDILCANAGIARRDARAWEADPDEWWRVVRGERARRLPLLPRGHPGDARRAAAGASSSPAAAPAYLPARPNTAYSASKAAVWRLRRGARAAARRPHPRLRLLARPRPHADDDVGAATTRRGRRRSSRRASCACSRRAAPTRSRGATSTPSTTTSRI